jgi:hypothetical protein
MMAFGSVRAISEAASPIAAHESRGDGSMSRLPSGRSGSWRATAAAWPTPVTTYVCDGPDSDDSREAVACSSDFADPVKGCRNLGFPCRDRGHRRVPLPPARMTE